MSHSFSAILPAPAERVVHSLGPSSRPAPEVRRLALPDRLTLEYVDAGPVDALPIVLLHGLSDTHRSFDQLWPHLPAHVRVVALTLRGHGDSDRPADGYTMPAMAADVAAAMDVLRVGPAVVVGHSMGARVALRVALDHPSRVRKLVFVSAFAPGLPNRSVDELVAAVAQLPAHLPVEFAREFQGACFSQPVDPQFVEAMVAQTLKVPTAVFRQVLDAFIADDTRAMLPRIGVPVQLIWGNRDAFVSRGDQRALLEALPNASLREYADVGHTPHWECPARFAADLIDFAAR
jgi:non-heme chloroperoxidase